MLQGNIVWWAQICKCNLQPHPILARYTITKAAMDGWVWLGKMRKKKGENQQFGYVNWPLLPLWFNCRLGCSLTEKELCCWARARHNRKVFSSYLLYRCDGGELKIRRNISDKSRKASKAFRCGSFLKWGALTQHSHHCARLKSCQSSGRKRRANDRQTRELS